MTRVTQEFSLPSSVPFVDVHWERDNRLFIDPSAIRNGTDALSRRAHKTLLSFFTEVVRCRSSGNRTDAGKGLRLLQQLHEPNETRLGMSRTRVAGHGFGAEMGERLWDELRINDEVEVAVISRLEDLRILVDGIGYDLISDLTTRIVYQELVDFTNEMVLAYPALGRDKRDSRVAIYDPSLKDWQGRNIELPYLSPHQLLLVPKHWVFWRTLMDVSPFYNNFSTEEIKLERTTYDNRGKALAPSKASIQREYPHKRNVNVDRVIKALNDGDDLLGRYRDKVDREFEPISDEEIVRRTR